MIIVGLHRRHLSQFTPLRDVFCVRAIPAACRLDVENVDAVGCLIDPAIFVFDFQVALEGVLRPQHYVMGIVFEFRTGRQSHALLAVRNGSDFTIEKPLRLPILSATIRENFHPRSSSGGLFERCLIVSDPSVRKDDRGFFQPVIDYPGQHLDFIGILNREVGAIVGIVLQVIELLTVRSDDQLVPAIDDDPCNEVAIQVL